MRSAVITGCTGEIGNALVRLLLAQGWEVHALCRPNSRRLRFLPQVDRLCVLECDLFDLASIAKALPERCDVFFHLGWYASYGPERLDPYGQARNITAALDAVNLAARLGCSVFVGA
ncbi:MAG: NAD-dependent epimerase/dehydratase family protein, partial [Deltaproteobacteria bacterium]|nr:NAD-dependent epimerase/dehydratase family protein [Deltaproteobacteria bacterium]